MRHVGGAGQYAALLGLVLSCSRAVPVTPSASSASALALPKARKAPASPRLFPPTHGPGTADAGVERDGSRRLLAFGLRVVQHPDGSLDVGDELLPAARSARFAELPPRLGGGFLFWIVSSSGTLLYRADGWTAKLVPLAQLDFEAERLVPGFDRLLVLPRREADYRALDLETGQPVPPIGLPLAPAYGAMAFVDGWFGAVQVPLRGTVVTFDAGNSWHPLGLPVASFEAAGDSLSLSTPSGDYLLDAHGMLSHVADRDEAKVSEAARAELLRALAPRGNAGASGPQPLLEVAALSGYPDGRDAAFVATGGSIFRVSLATGKVLERHEHAYPGVAECQGVRFGEGVGFVCGQGRELTRIFRVTQPLGLALVAELAGARAVADSGSGALVAQGGCAEVGSNLQHCVLRPNAPAQEVTASTPRDRLVALADGRVVAVTPPDADGPGSLSIWQGGAKKQVAMVATPKDARQKQLLRQGIWVDGMVESKPGVLSGWVVGSDPFAGVELTLDGKLTLRRLQDNASRALFAGQRALSLGENGLASESTDGGVEWQAVELPPELDLKAAANQGLRQGCSAVGCSFAGFTRVGYFDGRAPHSLASPVTPPRVAFGGPGGSRWLLHCGVTGEASPPALPIRPSLSVTARNVRRINRAAAPGAEEIDLPPLSPFWEQPPPALPEGFEGVDAGTEPYGVQLRLYASGPRGGDWTRHGALSISFVDRFSTKGGVRRSGNGRSPWPDAGTAADALGAEPSSNAAGLAAALDPGGNSGALLLNSRGTLDLFVFEAGRVPLHIANVARLGMNARFAGVVKTKAGVFLGSYDESTRAFRIYRVSGQDLDVALEVTDIPPTRGANAELTRSVAGDALGIWVRGTGWFIHPVDLENGTVDAPYVIAPSQLAALPEVCADGAEGFLLTGPVGLDPAIDAPAGFMLRGVEGRFRASALGICVDALAAQGEVAAAALKTAPAPRATGRPTVIATLSERKALGRRIELRCSN